MQFELKDESGTPLANLAFEIELPDGSVRKGMLDGNGRARIEGIPAGRHKVSFRDLDCAIGDA